MFVLGRVVLARAVAVVLLLPIIVLNAASQRGLRAPSPAGSSVVEGRVLNELGRPVQRAVVVLRPGAEAPPEATSSGSARQWQQTTSSGGAFRFEGIPPGQFRLSVMHSSYLPAEYGQRFVGQPGRAIELAPSEVFKVTFVLGRGGAIVGSVFDELGEPMADAMVRAYRLVIDGDVRLLKPANAKWYPSNDIGQYRISGLAPGDYFVAATYHGEGGRAQQAPSSRNGYAPTWYPGTSLAGVAQAVRIAAGAEVSNVSFSIVPAPIVTASGRIVTASGQSASRSQLTVTPSGTGGHALNPVVRVTQDGAFSVSDLAPGEYVLAARSSSGSDGMSRIEHGVVRLNVDGHPLENLVVQLKPGTPVTIRVQSPVPPPQSVRISVTPKGLHGTQQSGSIVEGRVRFDLASGLYSVHASGLPRGWVVERLTAGPREAAGSQFEVREGATIDLTLHISPHSATLTGNIVPNGSESLSGRAVVLFAERLDDRTEAVNGVRLAQTDEKGSFVIPELRAGTYFVIAVDYVDVHELYNPAFWARVLPYSIRLTLNAGGVRGVMLPLSSWRR